MTDSSAVDGRVSARTLFGLAFPALGVLVAEPLYLLFDSAVVGRLGALPLAGLAVGGLVLAQVSTQLTFLSYGTTARAARLHGAGRDDDARNEGVQATWLAVVLGLLLILVVQLSANPILSVLGGGGDITAEATTWLRVGVLGTPLILVTLAGNGWMRGVQDTVRPLRYVVAGLALSAVLCPVLVHGLIGVPALGLVGSAVANVIGQAVAATLFVSALMRGPRTRSLRPDLAIIRRQLVLGRDLVLRSFAFQACFLSAVTVASRFGAGAVGAHQVVLQLWNLVALMLDSLAIAAQSLVGAALGAGRGRAASMLASRVTAWSVGFAVVLAGLFAATHAVIPPLFTSDSSTLTSIDGIWWLFVALIPVAGVVFALDGVLLGAGDAAFLRNATLASAVVGFLPLIWLAAILDWGLPGIWVGLMVFVSLRAVSVVWRTASGAWIRTGTDTVGSRTSTAEGS
ncbi:MULTISPECIES: MATE family efflux transporter [unclassified Rhodococcus (in: high G+C Gram-positive bacteria)]|uniref:MATE family efflux transporter n=1 Tax=unclassified Rhodococcus (in: high G+C Gram-positive bacteria) TaxID=192944 RepID=UPI0006FCB05F|nr:MULTISPECIES: MATE family efflux transporter [unclassified Rhodococcus (in: high G+C Gram-positive bacteria)]KQU34777.1 MATE family efflux transporter [Rhodococcus sp. Leaf225]KQU45540.1 MATE family efflux transporter [Rhodococcus sp. Leaf258]